MLRCGWTISILSFSLLTLLPLHTRSQLIYYETTITNTPASTAGVTGVIYATFSTHLVVSLDASTADITGVTGAISSAVTAVTSSAHSDVITGITSVTSVAGITSVTATVTVTSVPSVTTSSNTAALVASTFTTTFQSQPTIIPAPKTKRATGAIVGGVLGGVALIALLLVIFFVYRRRQHRTHRTLVPLIHDQDYTQPLDKSAGRLARVVDEKGAAQKQRVQLRIRTDLEVTNHAASDPGSTANVSDLQSEFRRQVEVMSGRILELESQQRELKIYHGRLSGEDRSQPPPDYSATTGERSTV